MPCQSYEPAYDDSADRRADKALRDKLARIACKALQHIEDTNDGLEILILKDPEIAEWWSGHKKADKEAMEQRSRIQKAAAEKAAIARQKKAIMSRLSAEELKILGVK
jgi:hypothetical protein